MRKPRISSTQIKEKSNINKRNLFVRRINFHNNHELVLLLYRLTLVSLLLLLTKTSEVAAATGTGMKDLYKTLAIPKTASAKDITKAYRKLALKYHPDKVSPEERENAEKKFKEIGHAHDVLSDETKRKRYDVCGEQGLDENFHPSGGGSPGAGGFGGTNMDDFFEMNQGSSTTGKRFGNGPASMGMGGGNSVQVDLNEILQGFMGARRPTSNGGFFGTGMGNGMGKGMGGTSGMRMNNNPMFGQQQQQQKQQQRPRYTDKSKPQIQAFYCTLSDLSDVNGCTKKLKVSIDQRGEYENEKIYTIQVQPGWKDGTKIKFKATKDGMFPPMTFLLKEKKHKYLTRDGDDLIFHCAVTESQAKKGVKIKVPLPDGELLEIQTTPNEIKKGYSRSIAGKGMPKRKKREENSSQHKGDLIIQFRIRETS